jgi:hypothetical protein
VVLDIGAFLLHEQKTIITRGTRRRKFRIKFKNDISWVTGKVKVFGKALLHTKGEMLFESYCSGGLRPPMGNDSAQRDAATSENVSLKFKT